MQTRIRYVKTGTEDVYKSSKACLCGTNYVWIYLDYSTLQYQLRHHHTNEVLASGDGKNHSDL